MKIVHYDCIVFDCKPAHLGTKIGVRTLVESILCSGYAVKQVSIPTLRMLIEDIYFEKMEYDSMNEESKLSSLSEFLFHYMFRKYGLRRLAGRRLIDFCASLMTHCTSCARIGLFVTFCGLKPEVQNRIAADRDQHNIPGANEKPRVHVPSEGIPPLEEAPDDAVGTIQGSQAQLIFFLGVMKLVKEKRHGKAILSRQTFDDFGETTQLMVQTIDALSCARAAGSEAMNRCSPLLVNIAQLDPTVFLTALSATPPPPSPRICAQSSRI
jgi:hypothetical protein